MGMMVFTALENVVGSDWTVVVVPVLCLIVHRIFGCVRDWQRYAMTRMIVREAPIGTKVTSLLDHSGSKTTLTVEVGDRAPASPPAAEINTSGTESSP